MSRPGSSVIGLTPDQAGKQQLLLLFLFDIFIIFIILTIIPIVLALFFTDEIKFFLYSSGFALDLH